MALFAWKSYKDYAWGKNELASLSRTWHNTGGFGTAENLGVSLVDGMDTLWIMKAHDAFNEGAQWIEKKFNINIVCYQI
jgi:hypothetical protein